MMIYYFGLILSYNIHFMVRGDLIMLALIVGASVGAFAYGTFVIVKRALRKHKNIKKKEV